MNTHTHSAINSKPETPICASQTSNETLTVPNSSISFSINFHIRLDKFLTKFADSFVSVSVSIKTMDEQELLKRFTDCVYFLASPLTCKKGIECDYRHSEIARLNPRDCWYWLGGCCYNSDCAFRHPPLEGFKEVYHEPLTPNTGPALEKTNIPCYFYAKGFCNKADRCPFLHEPSACYKPVGKTEVPSEKQLPAEINIVSPPVQTVISNPRDPAQTEEHTDTVIKHTPDSHTLPSRSDSVESETEFVESEEHIIQSESDVYNDQSSDGYVEHEKWLDLDLSPGFRVLVEGETERLEYEEYEESEAAFLVNGEEHRGVDFHYPKYECFDNDFEQSKRISIFNRLSFKTQSVNKKLIYNVQRGLDLHDQFKEVKVVDFDRRRNSRPRGFRREVDFLRKAVPVNRYRPPLKKPRFVSSRKPGQQQKRESRVESGAFTGPKTLEQIREEKIKARENQEFGSNNRSGSDGFFQAPRPLSEILKNKRKMG